MKNIRLKHHKYSLDSIALLKDDLIGVLSLRLNRSIVPMLLRWR